MEQDDDSPKQPIRVDCSVAFIIIDMNADEPALSAHAKVDNISVGRGGNSFRREMQHTLPPPPPPPPRPLSLFLREAVKNRSQMFQDEGSNDNICTLLWI